VPSLNSDGAKIGDTVCTLSALTALTIEDATASDRDLRNGNVGSSKEQSSSALFAPF